MFDLSLFGMCLIYLCLLSFGSFLVWFGFRFRFLFRSVDVSSVYIPLLCLLHVFRFVNLFCFGFRVCSMV